MRNILTKLGLTENEKDLYLAFLQYREKTAAYVARKIQMDKSSAYRAVEELEKRGLLIKHPKKKGTTYSANDPENLKQLIEQKRNKLESQEKDLDSFIKLIKKDLKQSIRQTYIKLEKGIESWQNAMDDALESKEKLIRERFYLSAPQFRSEQHVKFVNNYVKRRVSKKIHIRQLDRSIKGSTFYEVMDTSEKLLKEVRILPDSLMDSNNFRVWDDTINIVSYDETKEFILITIKDKYVAELMKNMYDFIWKRSKVYYKQ